MQIHSSGPWPSASLLSARMNPQIGYTVTEHGVTEQWSYADSDPDFCTITRLAAHYVSLLQQCMAAALVWSWKLTTLEEDGTELWQWRC